jgi:hypothetical protein
MTTAIKPVTVYFGGGLNLTTALVALKPGEALQLHNYEVNTLGRYQTILGFERFDGKPAPSAVKASEMAGYPFPDSATEQEAVSIERELRRQVITRVPGTGPVLGVFSFKGSKYAIRQNETGSDASMYRSSANGWLKVTTPPLTVGVYETIQANFSGASDAIEIIGCNGEGKAFRFNGTTLSFINGPMTVDKPTHVAALPSQVLLMAYRGGTFVFSGVNEPEKFGPIDGGGEIGCADEIIGFSLQANNSCAVFCRNRTYVLYGKSKLDFNLTDLSTQTGAIPKSIQSIGDSIYLDDRGLTRLNRVQAFGNFNMATISDKIRPLIERYVNKVVGSWVVKGKNQYRLLFSDQSGLILTFFGDQVAGFSTFSYGKNITVAYSGETVDGTEEVFFGTDEGFVYQAERGFSFDGQSRTEICRLSYYNPRPGYLFAWKAATLETSMVGRKTLTVRPEYNFGEDKTPSDIAQQTIIAGGGGYWNSGVWDETAWSAAIAYRSKFYTAGVAENMGLLISSTTTNEAPHVLNSLQLFISPRGAVR